MEPKCEECCEPRPHTKLKAYSLGWRLTTTGIVCPTCRPSSTHRERTFGAARQLVIHAEEERAAHSSGRKQHRD